IVSIKHEKNICLRENLSKKNIVVRWIILYILIFSILIFGAFGPGYEPVDPMYADF
ncbi:MBOAT family protein, partial [bacterium]|nr:MBOAT family protein [bacterium]